MEKGTTIYELKIQLDGVTKPPIWRKVEVNAADTLADFHRIIQKSMGWNGGHLHQFIVNGEFYAAPSPFEDIFDEMDTEDASKISIEAALGNKKGAKIKYEYDFGDSWMHTISLESVKEAAPNTKYPLLVAGKGACPPEDCGGIWGYEELKATLADPESEDYEEMLEWLDLEDGSDFDPNDFDIEEHQL